MTETDKNIKENYKKQLTEALNDLKTPGKRHRQIPNILTASRLFSPLLIIPAALSGNTVFAAWAAAGFGFTDLIDGALARTLKVKSDLGADLDAFSDKIFAGTLLIGGAIFNPILVTNIILEMAIAGINLKQKFSGKKTESTAMGKRKTWAVFGLGALGIIAPALNLAPVLIPTLAIGTAALQGLTIASYIAKYKEQPQSELSEEPQQETKIQPPLDENAMPILDKTKTKEIVESAPTQIYLEEDKKHQTLEELRQMSDFLHQEQKNQTSASSTTPKMYQKTDTNNQ